MPTVRVGTVVRVKSNSWAHKLGIRRAVCTQIVRPIDYYTFRLGEEKAQLICAEIVLDWDAEHPLFEMTEAEGFPEVIGKELLFRPEVYFLESEAN